LHFVGENCDEQCQEGTIKNSETGKCVMVDYSSQNKTTIFVAALSGAIVLLLLLTAGGIRYHRHWVSMQPINFDELNLKIIENGTIADGQLVSECKPRELKRSSVALLELVGSGAFGEVWKATLDESSTTGSPEYLVAAKIIREGAPAEAKTALTTEAAVMAQLTGHKHLVSIVGVVTSGSPLILLLSYCDHGSMLSYLTTRIAARRAIPTEHKLNFAAQTARGMAHLAGRHFVHRDLAARNVLLTSGQSVTNLVCKVADFGLSRGGKNRGTDPDTTETEVCYRSSSGVFPVRWTAPEAMESLVFNQASDVWSFGILLIELIQDGDRPYRDLESNSAVVAFTMSGQRHPRPHGCRNDLYSLMLRCWDGEPKQRPSFTSLASELDQLYTFAAVWGEDITACHGRAGDNADDESAESATSESLFDAGQSSEGSARSAHSAKVEYEPVVSGVSGGLEVEEAVIYSRFGVVRRVSSDGAKHKTPARNSTWNEAAAMKRGMHVDENSSGMHGDRTVSIV
jgi:serine/threonine protein kinase